MTNRLEVVLGKNIPPTQGDFVPQRIVQDNVLLAHEVFHPFQNKKRKGWLVSN